MKTMFIGVIIVGIAIMIVLFAFNFINSMEIQPTSQDELSHCQITDEFIPNHCLTRCNVQDVEAGWYHQCMELEP
jgi:hypothetical protein